MPEISRSELRHLFRRVLRTDADFAAFSIDWFPEVAHRLTESMDRLAKENLLLTLADPAEILAALQRSNPEMVRRYWRGDREPPSISPTEPGDNKGPIPVVCFFAPEDERWFEQFRSHVAVFERTETIALWSPNSVLFSADLEASYMAAVGKAEIILLMLSADLLARHWDKPWIQQALKRWRGGECQLLTVLIRPVDYESTVLRGTLILPRGGKPISTFRSADQAWVEVARELGSALKYRTERVLSPEAKPPPTQDAQTSAFLISIDDIFVLSGFPKYTFVEPEQMKQILPQLRRMGTGLCIEGPSGIGKSTLIFKALQAIGVKSPEKRWFRSTDAKDLVRLDRVLHKPVQGYVVIDDFHYLDDARVLVVANALHAVATKPTPLAKMIFIGIDQVSRRLVKARDDLGHRLFPVSVSRQSEAKLADLIAAGEKTANIEFRHRAEMISIAGGSFAILQVLSYWLATRSGVDRTQLRTKIIPDPPAVVLPAILSQLEGQFDSDLKELIQCDEVSPPRGAGLSLIWLLARSASDNLTLDEARQSFPSLHLAFDWLRAGPLGRTISATSRIGRWLHYDGNQSLSIHDPRLGFYLRQLKWSLFIERMGPVGMRLSIEGDLEVRTTDAAPPPGQANGARAAAPGFCSTADAASRGPAASSPLRAFPADLLDALRRGKLVPFVGAGVSRAVKRRRIGDDLFPDWGELLKRAAKRVRLQGNAKEADKILTLIDGGDHDDYLSAARKARVGLPGRLWANFLEECFYLDEKDAEPASLDLPRALWRLGSDLIVTTNYDRVLEWACREERGHDAKVANIAAPSQLGDILSGSVKRPTVWHLHGSILDPTTLILTPDGYHRLYADDSGRETEYEAALLTLNSLLAGQTFLFIGWSFADQHFAAQVKWVDKIFRGNAGPHYMLEREEKLELTRIRLGHLPLQLVSFEGFGEPLLNTVRQMATLRSHSST